jgi:hypothetical protein
VYFLLRAGPVAATFSNIFEVLKVALVDSEEIERVSSASFVSIEKCAAKYQVLIFS